MNGIDTVCGMADPAGGVTSVIVGAVTSRSPVNSTLSMRTDHPPGGGPAGVWIRANCSWKAASRSASPEMSKDALCQPPEFAV